MIPKTTFRIDRKIDEKKPFDIFGLIRYKVVHQNESWDILCVGAKGVGKSSTMLRLAMLLDPNFSLDRWAFSTEELLEMRRVAGVGDVIVSDEMGTQKALSSQTWQDKKSKEVVDIHQLDRTERIINIGTTLDMGRINNRVRTQYKVIINIQRKLNNYQTGGNGMATECLVRVVEEDYFAKSAEDVKRKYFRDPYDRRIARVIIPHPPADIFRQYSVRRDEFKKRLIEAEQEKQQQKKASARDSTTKTMELIKKYS